MKTMETIRRDGERRRPALVYLHCSGSSGRQWAHFVRRSGDDALVLAPNLLGYDDDRPWPSARQLSVDDEVDALAPVLDALPGGVHLVGHSYGAAVALQIALRRPTSVRSLTIYEPVRFGLLLSSTDVAARAVGRAIVAAGRTIGDRVLQHDPQGAGERFIDYWSGRGSWAAMPARQRDAVAARMPKVRAEFEALFADEVPLAAYRRLRMPVHLMVGEDTLDPPREVARLLATAIPGVRVSVLGGLDHMGPVFRPEAVHAAMQPFLHSVLGTDLVREAA
jgi:pimeloyl-ACP methyl ester carboxylesterase